MNRRRPPAYQDRNGPAPKFDSAKIVALYLEGRTQVEVARLVGCTHQTVSVYVRRARRPPPAASASTSSTAGPAPGRRQ
jgi:hypothetical protein